MIVEGQNANIGSRNVHYIREGGSRSIGGRGSGYLIYLLPFGARIAEISRSDRTYTCTPIDPRYCRFEDEIVDCLDRDIHLLSRSGREVRIRFRRFVSRLEQINRIMHLTDKAGAPDFDD